MHISETGTFQELAHASDVKFGQLSILAIKPGCKRGGHYHKRKEEWFCCIQGKCQMIMTNVKDDSVRVVIMDEKIKEFVLIKPYESHTVVNLSHAIDCGILIIVSEEYNPDEPDTYKYERKVE